MKRGLLALVFLCWAIAAHAAVAFDANSTADCTGNAVLGTTGLTCSNLTVGSGSNRVLVVQLAFNNQSITTVAVNWDQLGTPQAMTLIKTVNTTGAAGRAELWGLVAPTSGAKQAKVTWNATNSDVTMNAVSWTGANQTGGATTFPNSTSAQGTSTTSAVTITSAVGDATMDSTVLANGAANFSAPTQTQTYLDNTPANISGAGSRAAGAATVTHQWTLSASVTWANAGTDIAAAGGAVAVPKLSILGVGH